MERTAHFQTLVLALMSNDLRAAQQFSNVVFGLSLLASHQKLQTDDALKQRLQHLLKIWTDGNDDLEREVTPEDVDDAEALLRVASLDVVISDPGKDNLDSGGWSEQLRFGTAAVLAATYRRANVNRLFESGVFGAVLLERLYAEVIYLHTGVTLTSFGDMFTTNRFAVSLLVTQLQQLLDSETRSVAAILDPNADDFDLRVGRVRFAMVAALSRLALLECKND